MNFKPWCEALAVVVFLIAATLAIAASGADISISSLFYVDGRWPVGARFPWRALYLLEGIPAIILATAGLMGLLASLWRKKYRHWAKPGIFLILLLALGPGLVVNLTFKDNWGRPRPGEIVQFGGKKKFLQPWQMGISGQGRAFPSGHSSAAFYMTAPFFIYRCKRKRLARAWLAGGLLFGILMSIARIVQGGHFLSDTLWAWGMVHLCALFLAALLRLDHTEAPFPAAET